MMKRKLNILMLAGREFLGLESEPSFMLGGYSNTYYPGGIIVKAPCPWQIKDLKIEIDKDNGDIEFLEALSHEKPVDALIEFDDNQYAGKGKPFNINPMQHKGILWLSLIGKPGTALWDKNKSEMDE